MAIWKQAMSLEFIREVTCNTAAEHLGIEIVEVGDDYVRGTMPVDRRTHQPYGILHGGASVVLAETLGSLGAQMASPEGFICVGLDINANHLRQVREGTVVGTARPLHVGRSTQVWEIRIETEEGRLVCVSRLTCAVLEARSTG